MYIHEVMSFKNSWNSAKSRYQGELKEVMEALDDYLSGRVKIEGDEYNHPRRLWEKALYDRGWEIIERTRYTTDGRRVNIGHLGPTKNGASAQMQMGFPQESLARWLFHQAAIALKHNLISLPMLLVPMKDCSRRMKSGILSRSTFEMFQDQLGMLSPLTFSYPFLIIGYSDEGSLLEPIVTEIEEDSHFDSAHQVINRCIEFPPEYHQAGLGILNYFATYLREQYPHEEAAVRIEQCGLKVKLIITTETGHTETIEKALKEYEIIVTGQEPPEKFTQNDKLLLELRNELRIAKYRIESQGDIISLQNAKMDKLLDIIGDGLQNKHQPITIDFKPVINTTTNVQVNPNISLALGSISELKELIPTSSDAYLALDEVESSLAVLERETNPELVRKSPAMSKFRRTIEKFSEEGSTLRKALDATESGLELFKDIAGKYNRVAEWCGLPQVPSVFI